MLIISCEFSRDLLVCDSVLSLERARLEGGGGLQRSLVLLMRSFLPSLVTGGGEEGDLSVWGAERVVLLSEGFDADLGDPHAVAFDGMLLGEPSTAKGFLEGAAGVVLLEVADRLDDGLPPEVKPRVELEVDLTDNLFKEALVVKDAGLMVEVEVGVGVRVGSGVL